MLYEVITLDLVEEGGNPLVAEVRILELLTQLGDLVSVGYLLRYVGALPSYNFV